MMERDTHVTVWNDGQLQQLVLLGLRTQNPYAHPRYCGVVEKDIVEGAQKYFCWMLLNSASIEELKLDPYWKYMED